MFKMSVDLIINVDLRIDVAIAVFLLLCLVRALHKPSQRP
jgi:hypothetical protein